LAAVALDRRRPAALVALLLLLWQSFVLQTHSHLPVPGAAAQSGDRGTGRSWIAPRHDLSDDDPSTCPICSEMAQSGHYLTPTPAALAAPAPVLAGPLFAFFLLWPDHHVPHGWYGRGPPSLLQAR
jgi:hypothetical protein